jgi:hypothetical protein
MLGNSVGIAQAFCREHSGECCGNATPPHRGVDGAIDLRCDDFLRWRAADCRPAQSTAAITWRALRVTRETPAPGTVTTKEGVDDDSQQLPVGVTRTDSPRFRGRPFVGSNNANAHQLDAAGDELGS